MCDNKASELMREPNSMLGIQKSMKSTLAAAEKDDESVCHKLPAGSSTWCA